MIYISFDIGVKNLALCILSHDGEDVSIIDWNVICLSEKSRFKVDTISHVLYSELDRIVGSLKALGIDHIDRVIIENQPSNLNGIMKTIQYLIYSYFYLSKHWNEKVGDVILINPAFKLQNHEFCIERDATIKLTRSERYRNNKRDGIEVCRHYIKNEDRLLRYFNSHKKKDDLADTCIQTISYIRKNGSDVKSVGLSDINFFIE